MAVIGGILYIDRVHDSGVGLARMAAALAGPIGDTARLFRIGPVAMLATPLADDNDLRRSEVRDLTAPHSPSTDGWTTDLISRSAIALQRPV
jgi:hypothetical protein